MLPILTLSPALRDVMSAKNGTDRGEREKISGNIETSRQHLLSPLLVRKCTMNLRYTFV